MLLDLVLKQEVRMSYSLFSPISGRLVATKRFDSLTRAKRWLHREELKFGSCLVMKQEV
jgi:hypothetical protein